MSTITIIIFALAITITNAQFLIRNNCEHSLLIRAKVLQGFNPIPDGELFQPGFSLGFNVLNDTWAGSFYAEELKTSADFLLRGNVSDKYTGSVITGFNYPLEIIPTNTSCPVVRCLNKPSDECMNAVTELNKLHDCSGSSTYTIIFCPENPEFQQKTMPTQKKEKALFLSRV